MSSIIDDNRRDRELVQSAGGGWYEYGELLQYKYRTGHSGISVYGAAITTTAAAHIAQQSPARTLTRCDQIDDLVETLREISGEGCGVVTSAADCGDCWACVATACLRRLGIEP